MNQFKYITELQNQKMLRFPGFPLAPRALLKIIEKFFSAQKQFEGKKSLISFPQV